MNKDKFKEAVKSCCVTIDRLVSLTDRVDILVVKHLTAKEVNEFKQFKTSTEKQAEELKARFVYFALMNDLNVGEIEWVLAKDYRVFSEKTDQGLTKFVCLFETRNS
jgi:hypothetical protein